MIFLFYFSWFILYEPNELNFFVQDSIVRPPNELKNGQKRLGIFKDINKKINGHDVRLWENKSTNLNKNLVRS